MPRKHTFILMTYFLEWNLKKNTYFYFVFVSLEIELQPSLTLNTGTLPLSHTFLQ